MELECVRVEYSRVYKSVDKVGKGRGRVRVRSFYRSLFPEIFNQAEASTYYKCKLYVLSKKKNKKKLI